jgi:hypothetical protein
MAVRAMADWRKEYRKCDRCRGEYRPKRQAQSYCSERCRNNAVVSRRRSGDKSQILSHVPRSGDISPQRLA